MPPATSATEGLRELRWPRSVGPSTYLAPPRRPTLQLHTRTAPSSAASARYYQPHPRHGGITGSQPKSRTITPSRWPSPGKTAPGAFLVVVPGPEDALAEPTLASERPMAAGFARSEENALLPPWPATWTCPTFAGSGLHAALRGHTELPNLSTSVHDRRVPLLAHIGRILAHSRRGSAYKCDISHISITCTY